jgi:hypothetical protein
MPTPLKLKNLDQVMHCLDRLILDPTIEVKGGWGAYQHLIHCGQTIYFSMQGYPIQNPKIMQYTVVNWSILFLIPVDI